MSQKALCVGINEFQHLPMNSWLAGCVNDAHDIAEMLGGLGFPAESTTVLTDGEATKRRVMGELTALVDGAQPGDHLVFSFSSHGTQVPNQTDDPHDEPDGLDEAFACYDIREADGQWDTDTVIVDDELRELFARLPDGVLLEVVLDTCHSGSGLRRLEEVMQDLLLGRRPRFLPQPTPKEMERVRELRAAGPRTVDRQPLAELATAGPGSRPVLMAACLPSQTAADATFDGRSNGAFTYVLLKALAATPDATRAELHDALSAALAADNFEQVPTLEGPDEAKAVGFGKLWSIAGHSQDEEVR